MAGAPSADDGVRSCGGCDNPIIPVHRRPLSRQLQAVWRPRACRLARNACPILQAEHGRNDLFSAPPDSCRRDDFGNAAGARGAHAGRALRAGPRRPVAVRHARVHARGRSRCVVADCDCRLFRRLFHRDADGQRGFGANSTADAAVPDRRRRARVGRCGSGRFRTESSADHFRRARWPRRAMPRRGDGVLRRAFRAAQGVGLLAKVRCRGIMDRRTFISGLATSAALPLAVRAQEAGRIYRLGFLIPATRTSAAVAALFDELRLNGFVEGQNLIVVGSFGVTAAQAADGVETLVKAAPDAIVSGPELYTRALHAATRTIPLISISEDLISEGLVASLAKPGGNITGISLLSPELDDKRQDILIDAVPGIRRMAALADSTITP